LLDSKLARIKELIAIKEKTDTELAQLLGQQEKPARRGRPKKDAPEESGASQADLIGLK
jgi:hypothetical protein